MTSAPYSWPRPRLAAAGLLGVWAAAVAVAPTVETKLLIGAPAVLLAFSCWTIAAPARWLAGFLAAALLLPPLPVAWGDSGPHVCLFFAALGLLGGVWWLPRSPIPGSALNRAVAAFLLVLLASVAPAALDSGAAIAGGSLVRVGLFGISIFVFLFAAYGPGLGRDPFSAIRSLYWIAVASALFACVDFYFQFPAPAGYGSQFVWLDSGVYRRAQGIFYDAGTLGNFCAFFLVMIAVCFSRRREETPLARKALAAGGLIFSFALVLSYSRSSLLNVLTALAVLAWMNRSRLRPVRVAAIAVPSFAAAALLAWKVFPQFVEAYWLRLSASVEYFSSATGAVLSGRLDSWRTLAGWISAHPWQALFGIGYKTLPYTSYLGAPVVGDNMYLSLLVETGVLGLAALLWMNVAILRASAVAARAPESRKAFFGTWMLCFWSGQMVQMLSVDVLTFWRVLPAYFLVLALAVRA